MSETEETDVPKAVYQTESIDDLEALLGKAEKWAESMGREGIAAEFRDGREFVEDELVDDQEEKELVTDGGQLGTEVSR